MEQNKKKIELGGSLPVPWVQDLAKTITTVPERYIRADQDPPSPITGPEIPFPAVPVIDMSRLLLSGDVDSPELLKLHTACRDWGFFQVINHGVSSEVVAKMKIETENIFKLPMEEKKKLWQRDGHLDGFGQAFVVSDQQKLDWADIFYAVILPRHHRKPYLFPHHLPQSFQSAAEDYSKGVRAIAMEILKAMARALKMEEEEMKEVFGGDESMQAFRVNFYPPCPEPELVAGFTPHSDAVGLTVLLQVNEVDGLEIRKDGRWIPVKPLPNAFVVNVGDILEMVTNGNYRSVEHRAMVNSVKERLSIAAFHNPKLDGDFGPARSLVTPRTPALFRRVNLIDYFKRRYSLGLQAKPYIDLYRLGEA